MSLITAKKTDRESYDEEYKGRKVHVSGTKQDYISHFEKVLSPFFLEGTTKGFVRGMATARLLDAARASGKKPREITILDAGCGLGKLSVYLACKGYNVIGVDISSEGCALAEVLATKLSVTNHCRFLAESLEDLSMEDSSVDFIIGHASLHHFIKYERVPTEFARVLRIGGEGFFADSFGENVFYHIFHDKKKMARLGDVSLTKHLITSYFSEFEVELVPTDWLVMLDKLYIKLFPKNVLPLIRKLSRVHFWIDRRIPTSSRVSLAMSGAVMIRIKKLPRQDNLVRIVIPDKTISH